VKDPVLALESVRGLASYEDPSAPITILANYSHFSPELRTAAINTLCTRKSYARVLIDALKSKQVAPSDISAFQARQIIALRDAAISEQFRSLWGDARQTPVEKRATIDQLRSVLTPQLQQANLEKGKQTFQRTCASCHVLFGEGGKIGPDLTGSNRKNLDYILENIIDPSAVVGAQFRVSTFTLADGRVVNGIIQAQNERTLTIDTPDGRILVDRTDIDETTPSEKSLMPDGMLQTLNEEQTRDLVGYLMSQ
jgi:putative heme-binding domain-containing protein